MERGQRPRFLHGSWNVPGGVSASSTSSSSNLSIVVQAAGAASHCAGGLDTSIAPQVSSTSSSRRRKPNGALQWAGAGNPAHMFGAVRPALVCLPDPGSCNRVADGRASPPTSTHLAFGACIAGAATSGPARPLCVPPVTLWDQRVAAPCACALGPTFALTRSIGDTRTEGVMAPNSLAALGITDMLTLADCFDSDAEVRGAFGAAPQNEQDLAA